MYDIDRNKEYIQITSCICSTASASGHFVFQHAHQMYQQGHAVIMLMQQSGFLGYDRE